MEKTIKLIGKTFKEKYGWMWQVQLSGRVAICANLFDTRKAAADSMHSFIKKFESQN